MAVIVVESDGPGISIIAVARCYKVRPSQPLTLRRLVRHAVTHDSERSLHFLPAVMSVGPQEPTYTKISRELRKRCGAHGIEVEIAGATIRIVQGASPAQIAAVIRALKTCP